jgi:hypothetical protein
LFCHSETLLNQLLLKRVAAQYSKPLGILRTLNSLPLVPQTAQFILDSASQIRVIEVSNKGKFMSKLAMRVLLIYAFTTLTNTSLAASLRCQNKLVHIGETKADTVEKCGGPVFIDSFCRPIPPHLQTQGIQNGDDNTLKNVAITICENIDIWTYNPGTGKFLTHLYFSKGHLESIHYGERVN